MNRIEGKRSRYFWKIMENVILLIFICMLILVISQVFFRYVLRISVPWTEEAARWFYIWQIFLGSALAMKHKLHIRVVFMREKLSPTMQKWLDLGSVLLGLAFFGGVWWGAIRMMQTMYPIYAASFNVRMTYLYLSIPVGIGLMIYLIAKDLRGKLKSK
jgi:TRAP-type C4-dicarboxylate transport system permease small subunit